MDISKKNYSYHPLVLAGLFVIGALVFSACAPSPAQIVSPTAAVPVTGPTAIPTAPPPTPSSLPAIVSPSPRPTEKAQVSSSRRGSTYEDYGYDQNENNAEPAATQAPSGDTAAEIELRVAENDQLGSFLVDQAGRTVYLFTRDTPNTSNCSGKCLDAWPPLLANDEVKADDGLNGKLGTITRPDGTRQVTYNEMPLYYYAADQKPGDTLGQGTGDVWFVVTP